MGLRSERPVRLILMAVTASWLVGRAPDLLLHPRVWAEEGSYLSAATRLGFWESLSFVYWRAGYLSWPPGLGATIGYHLLPLEMAPAATTLIGFLCQAAPALAVASLRFEHPISNAQRFIASIALLCATTSSQGVAWINALSAQMHLGILASVMLIASARQATERASRLCVIALFMIGISGAYGAPLLGTFALAALSEGCAWRRRQAIALAVATFAQACTVAYGRFALGLTHEKRAAVALDPTGIVTGMRETIALPMFGMRAIEGDRTTMNLLLFVSILLLVSAIAILARSRQEHELLRGGAFLGRLGSMGLRMVVAWVSMIVSVATMAFGGVVAGRYAVVPGALTLGIVMLAAIRTRSRAGRHVLSLAVAASILAGLEQPRSSDVLACNGISSGWRDAVRSWDRRSPLQAPICPPGWSTKLHPPHSRKDP